ncbi:MAG TPA: YoaP domain-containing protein [Acidobacteriota bacterium]|nr:YoaP domain-containing protein [Acidobacteriota bacterium]
MKHALRLIDVTPEQLGDLPCCGIKNVAHEGHQCKTEWLAQHLRLGLRAKILVTEDDRQCGYIEYLPGEQAWRTVDAAGYMFIHCIWTFYKVYQHKGNAARLVQGCIEDARKEKMHGAAVITRQGPWLASSDLFLKCGFERVATAPPDYELLVKKFRKSAPDPRFLPITDCNLKEYGSGLTILRANQCPHGARFARQIGEVAEREFNLEPRQVVLSSARDAQSAPTPYAVFSIIYNGTVLSDHQISKTRFRNIMRKVRAET